MALLQSFLFFLQTVAENLPKEPKWYEYAAGVIAVPGTLLAAAYSYVLIRKTRIEARKLDVETRKLELELKEKEQAGLPEVTGEVREMFQPLIRGQQVQFIVLRFILLYLILHVWGLLSTLMRYLVTGTAFGLVKTFPSLDTAVNDTWLFYPAVIIWTIVPNLLYWGVFILFGWPLFKDVNKILGISFKGLFRRSS